MTPPVRARLAGIKVPHAVRNPRLIPHIDAGQYPRPGLVRGLVYHSLRLDRSEGSANLRSALFVKMVLQWRNQWLREEHALQGGYGDGKLLLVSDALEAC